MVEAARLYYEFDLSQQEIANHLGVSRPGVSRLLQKAREEGIVQISIVDPSGRGTRMEQELKNRFHLKEAVVVPGDSDSVLVKQRLGIKVAELLDNIIFDNAIIGVSWGTTMFEVAHHIRHTSASNITVVQLNGGVAKADYDTRANEVPLIFSRKLGAAPYLLPLPAIVDSIDVKNAILMDKNSAQTLELGQKAQIAIFTIGQFSYQSVLVKADYFSQTEVEKLLMNKSIADICSRIIDTEGNICLPELDERTIGIRLEDLKEKEYSIAVAGGKEKIKAVQAAIRGKYFNVLITDDLTAHELLKMK